MRAPLDQSADQKAENMKHDFEQARDGIEQEASALRAEHPRVPTLELRPDGMRSADALAAAGGLAATSQAAERERPALDLKAEFEHARGPGRENFRDLEAGDELGLEEEQSYNHSR